MSAAVAQRQSSSPVQPKIAPSIAPNKVNIKPEGRNDSSPREENDMDTPSNYLVSDKFLAAEPNPFEQSFAIRPGSSGNGTDTSKPALPSVLEMFTPGGTNQYEHFGFAESLRHGPLSPNLLNGPQGPLPFDPTTFRTGLTPNESNIRTGLTPGNLSGFPLLPTPGTAALLGAYTPNTTAAIASMQPTSFPPVSQFNAGPPRSTDVFGESQAANGLVFLAQTSQQQSQQNLPNASTREELVKRGAANNSKINAYQDPSTLMNNVTKSKSDESTKNIRSKKVKAEEALTNAKESTSNKKSKIKIQETDDDKRRNFLERNRQAALKCRQRKKQWLSSLQQKVDWYTRENELLSSEVGQLREQVTNLKTLLAAHKDCPIAEQNGANPEAIAQAVGQAGVFPIHKYR